MRNRKGFTIIELIVGMGIFSVIIASAYMMYATQVKHASREYKVAGAEIELGIAKHLVERDVFMAGYGLPDDFGCLNFIPAPRPIEADDTTNTVPDSLTLRGTALGAESTGAQRWTYIDAVGPVFIQWGDIREDLEYDDHVIVMEPSTRKLIYEGNCPSEEWLYRYVSDSINVEALPSYTALTKPSVGNVVYGIGVPSPAPANARPFAAVRYSLGGTPPSACATGTQNLIREESWTDTFTGGDIMMACVLNMQVAFGLDADENGTIDLWDNGGTAAAGYDIQSLEKRLKQVRVYLLMQNSKRDQSYTFPQASVRVGEAALGTGDNIALTAEQRKYKWKLLTYSETPRNLR